jgi:ATP-binding cassette subfamily B protein
MISHVPQSIFLSDASIRENIAFGINAPDIDDERVIMCAQIAKISETIERMEKSYSTEIGERGVRLSGGQRQRLGIARALYKKSAVIIFDEATSSLDNETEKNVMDSIYSMDKSVTIIMVAHRLSTLNSCDFIYKFHNGTIKLVKGNK